MQTQTADNVAVDEAPQVFIGRQPIFDRDLNVVGYELLFRPGNTNAYDSLDGNHATSQVINNLLIEIGLDELIGDKPAYINFTKELLMNGVAELLPAKRVVLEVLETVDVDEDLTNSVKSLAQAGYSIALDDFTFAEEWLPLIKCARIIKFDIMMHSKEEVSEQLKKFSGEEIKLLAEKVETQDEFNHYKEAGFDYFQGYFFSKPVVLNQKALSSNSLSLLQLVAKLQSPDIEVEEIEKLISQDVSLSYKLFRSVNSAAFGLKNKMTSIKQAVVYFGLQRLKNWASLMVIASNSNKSPELIHTGLVRAKMCELLAEEAGLPEKDAYFIVGLFSILDAVLDQPLETILSQMPLEESLNNALLNKDGDMGEALKCSISCEQCDWNDIHFRNIENYRLHEIHLDAMIWSQKSFSELDKS